MAAQGTEAPPARTQGIVVDSHACRRLPASACFPQCLSLESFIMTSIASHQPLYAATRGFMDTQPLDGRERGFMDIDSTVHAILDQANLGNDNKTMYGADLPRSLYNLFRSGGNSASAAPAAEVPETIHVIGPDAQVDDAQARAPDVQASFQKNQGQSSGQNQGRSQARAARDMA
ncbi:hypothetical protein [Achromobacter aloeverae]